MNFNSKWREDHEKKISRLPKFKKYSPKSVFKYLIFNIGTTEDKISVSEIASRGSLKTKKYLFLTQKTI